MDEECRNGVESNSGNLKMVGEVLGPGEKEIGNDGDGRGRMGVEPLNNGVMELAEGSHDGEISMVADVANVFDTNGEFGVRR